MDEQCLKAYLELIMQLVDCPQGQEAELLQEHLELVDSDLLSLMDEYADFLESLGNSDAVWLRQFRIQLGHKLGLGTWEIVEMTPLSKGVTAFLLDTLELVDNSQGNPEKVYPVWEQQQEHFNLTLLEVLTQFGADLPTRDAELQFFVTPALVTFGNLIQQFPLGTRWLNLELSITAYQIALQVCTREAFPEQWATTQHNLAAAYSDRIRGERVDNLKAAIAAYQLALEVYTREDFPEQWEITHRYFVSAYSDYVREEKFDIHQAALTALQTSFEADMEAFPEKWARQARMHNKWENTYKNRSAIGTRLNALYILGQFKRFICKCQHTVRSWLIRRFD